MVSTSCWDDCSSSQNADVHAQETHQWTLLPLYRLLNTTINNTSMDSLAIIQIAEHNYQQHINGLSRHYTDCWTQLSTTHQWTLSPLYRLLNTTINNTSMDSLAIIQIAEHNYQQHINGLSRHYTDCWTQLSTTHQWTLLPLYRLLNTTINNTRPCKKHINGLSRHYTDCWTQLSTTHQWTLSPLYRLLNTTINNTSMDSLAIIQIAEHNYQQHINGLSCHYTDCWTQLSTTHQWTLLPLYRLLNTTINNTSMDSLAIIQIAEHNYQQHINGLSCHYTDCWTQLSTTHQWTLLPLYRLLNTTINNTRPCKKHINGLSRHYTDCWTQLSTTHQWTLSPLYRLLNTTINNTSMDSLAIIQIAEHNYQQHINGLSCHYTDCWTQLSTTHVRARNTSMDSLAIIQIAEHNYQQHINGLSCHYTDCWTQLSTTHVRARNTSMDSLAIIQIAEHNYQQHINGLSCHYTDCWTQLSTTHQWTLSPLYRLLNTTINNTSMDSLAIIQIAEHNYQQHINGLSCHYTDCWTQLSTTHQWTILPLYRLLNTTINNTRPCTRSRVHTRTHAMQTYTHTYTNARARTRHTEIN